jgi:arginyl-tRNA--protein-N-Asp/Glu arginylyltransferase
MFNINNNLTIEENYQLGLLPQRNSKNLFYQQGSCRSNLSLFNLSSENRRILKNTSAFSFEVLPLTDFSFSLDIQKKIFKWVKNLGWDFPVSSIKNIFVNHIFNRLYIWKNNQNDIIAYSLCFFSNTISHIAYVFYNPEYSRGNLPIRLTLQVIIDSNKQHLLFCYLGRFEAKAEGIGYYKRNMPGFEYFSENQWIKLNKIK